jgi:uncharacterized integral membrane protein (TIGR00697 family)
MSNLIVAASSFVVFTFCVLVAGKCGKVALFGLSIAFIIMSNITVQINVEVVPGITISWAIIIYSMVYLITDLVIEFYGRSVAYRLAATNLFIQLLLWLYVWLSLMATPAASGNSSQVYDTMKSLFGTTTQITIAAIVAAIGPFADIFATGHIREYLKAHRFFRDEIFNLLARTKLSTLLGEIVNTVIFFGLALVGTGTPFSILMSIIVSATIAKWVISLADAPFLWLYFRFVGPPKDHISRHAT